MLIPFSHHSSNLDACLLPQEHYSIARIFGLALGVTLLLGDVVITASVALEYSVAIAFVSICGVPAVIGGCCVILLCGTIITGKALSGISYVAFQEMDEQICGEVFKKISNEHLLCVLQAYRAFLSRTPERQTHRINYDALRLLVLELFDRCTRTLIASAPHDVLDGIETLIADLRQVIIDEDNRLRGITSGREAHLFLQDHVEYILSVLYRELGFYMPEYAGQQFDTVAFSGGGAKGACYEQIVEMLRGTALCDIISPNCRFTGTSVGGIVALFCCLGEVDPEVLRAITTETQEAMLAGDREIRKLERMYPGLKMTPYRRMMSGVTKFVSGRSNMSGLPIVHLMDMQTSKYVRNFLDGLESGFLDALRQSRPTEYARVQCLLEDFCDGGSREGKMVTFADLEMLRTFPGGERFRSLALTTYDLEGRKTVHLNAQTTPNMPIPFGIRATIGLPGLLQKLEFSFTSATDTQLLDEVQTTYTLVDGGIGQNLPLNAFDDAEAGMQINIMFDCDGSSRRNLEGEQSDLSKYRLGARIFPEMGAAIPGMTGRVKELMAYRAQHPEDLWIILGHPGLTTTGFNFDPGQARLAAEWGATKLCLAAERQRLRKPIAEHILLTKNLV
ncbi:MAG: patatin-like phospholipase family protein [Puniceicoccales bacterium]|nr:patatin-like phospholipase family protein [Puniceicoccales bacterium]